MPLIVLLLALGLAACGDGAPARALEGELRYVKSGGIDGRHEELVVRPDGRATLRSGGKGERTFELSAAELDALIAEASQMRTDEVVSDPATPDALVYTIEYDGNTARTDDPKLGRSEIRPMVAQLEKVIEAHR